MKKPLPPACVEAIREEFDAYVDSRPPPARMTSAFDNVAARLETPTGVHDLRKLQEEHRAMLASAAAEKIAAAERRATIAETKLETARKFWLDVAKGALTTVIAACLLAVGAMLFGKK